MQTYRYEGPVMSFDRCIAHNWVASTLASSPAKAKSNLTFRFKKENGMVPNAKISLPGKVISV